MDAVPCPILVGRETELEALGQALAAATAGRGGVVALTGSAGVGKSRLLRELAQEATRQGCVVLTGRAVPTGATAPLRPFVEALQQAFRSTRLPTDDELGLWPGTLADVLPQDGSRSTATGLGAVGPTPRAEAIVRLLRSRSTSALLLALEDLHWADPDSLAVLEYLADNLYDERVLCVATVRSEPATRASSLIDELDARRSITRLRLAAMPDDAVARLVLACRPTASPAEIQEVVAAADGLPFLAEELLAAPGVPASLAASVADRLAVFPEPERRVIQSAAVLGRQFDWRLLSTVSATDARVVRAALERAVDCLLLAVHGNELRFRHTLTRDAIVDAMLPPARVELATAAVAAIESPDPGSTDARGDVSADLAELAGLTELAAVRLLAEGRKALERGALATAADSLQRAARIGADEGLRRTATSMAVEALALAGRLDEALAVAEPTLRFDSHETSAVRTDMHLAVTHAAVEATRWDVARHHLSAAEHLLDGGQDSPSLQRWRLLAAECALAERDAAGAQRLAELVAHSDDVAVEVRCHALALLGRARRNTDLDRAKEAFEQALTQAEIAVLPLWRMRALHELGTIDLFDHAGTDRLEQAKRTAEQLGALSTAAVLDIQLAAAHLFRFEPDAASAHARSGLASAERLRLAQLQPLSLVFLSEAEAIRLDTAAMEQHISRALAGAGDDPEIEGSVWGARATASLLADDDATALRCLARADALLGPLPGAGPALYLGFWPLLLSVTEDPRAAKAIAAARRTGVTINRGNRGLLGLAEAVLTGRKDGEQAGQLIDRAAADLSAYPVWGEIALVLTARAALTDDWGLPRAWLERARPVLESRGLTALTRRCDTLLAAPLRHRLSALGITAREREILELVASGRSNKDVAAQLFLSPRTVEKHVESLLRKTGASSRTALAAQLAGAVGDT